MNTIGEKIEISTITKQCRVMNVQELIQLLSLDRNIFWSWGAHAVTVDSKTEPRMLRMKVNGHHHKGHVYIFVNGMDLFDVYLTSSHGTIKTIGEGLYFDMLVDWIDTKIEKIPEYK